MKEFEIRDYFFDTMSVYGLKYGKKELTIDGLRIDIFAIGNNNTPYIIELKKTPNRYIVGQATQYLLLIPKYCKQIEKEMNHYKINWETLKILCIAPEFYERDFSAYKNNPLKNKIHFYKINILQNNYKQILTLNLEYFGPEKYGPLILPAKISSNNDLIKLRDELFMRKNSIARRNYYKKHIAPLFNEIDNCLIKYKYIELFKNTYYWDYFFCIKYSINKTSSPLEEASISIHFYENKITYGFEMDKRSYKEGKKLYEYFNNLNNYKLFLTKILRLNDYDIWIPSAKIINDSIKINSYNYKDDATFRFEKEYKKNTMVIHDIMSIINQEYLKFKFIFEIIV